MGAYGQKERALATVLSAFPNVKNLLKRIYVIVNYLLLADKKFTFDVKEGLKLRRVASFNCDESDINREYFFGYYDKSPINGSGLLLTHYSDWNTRKYPNPKKPIGVFVLDINKENGPLVDVKTSAYNWQQGARVHWLDNDLFIYNDFDGSKNRYVSKVYSVSNNTLVKTFDYPVQDSYEKEYILSINYQRILALRPDYGYRNLPPLTKEELRDNRGDGIWKVDYHTGRSVLLVSLESIIATEYTAHFDQAIHKVNHVLISPDGDKFIFIHRYYVNNIREDRLILSDSSGGEMKVLADYGKVSHCYWIDNENVISFMRNADGVDAYYIIDIEKEDIQRLKVPELDRLGDGHPNVLNDMVVTDSYPDRCGIQHLVLFNLSDKKISQIGRFHHDPFRKTECRCDLHPRFSLRGDYISFDSVMSGKRDHYLIQL